MKNNKNMKIEMLALFLAFGFLLQACSSTNQNKTIELEIRDTETLNEVRTEDEINTEELAEVATSKDTSNTDNTAEKADTPEMEIVETNSLTIDLTDDEIASLIFMREEEKLAKDIYLGLYDLWGMPIFQNIANSEQTHTNAVKNLLDKFGIEDLADASPIGVFANEDLQKLYDELMVIGAKSLSDALKVGGVIEEIDILDLHKSLESTQNDDIRRVYNNLLRGSENHLRAFTSTLEQQTNEIYKPQYMTQGDYDAIIESSAIKGGRGKGNRP